MVQAGKDEMLRDHPDYDPAFAEEWAKRMRARTKVDDYINVVIRVYEKHFTQEEIEALIKAQRDFNDSRTPTLPQPIKEKLASQGVEMQSEILGGCTQVGAKLGGEIGQEIAAEHPEWIKQSKPDQKPKGETK